MIKLFTDIKITNGYLRSVIQDFNRKKIYHIPLLLSKLIEKFDGKIDYNMLKKYAESKNKKYLLEYYNFLTERDLIFNIKEILLPLFPEISTEYDYPFEIDIITVLLSPVNYHQIVALVEKGVFSMIRCMNIIVCSNITEFELKTLVDKILHDESLYIKIVKSKGGQESSKYLHELNENDMIRIEWIDSLIDDTYFKGIHYQNKYPILQNQYALYTETLYHNPYFNKSLFVDYNGNIKNVPELKYCVEQLENIETYDYLVDKINNTRFKKYWTIDKSQIEICKICEYRHMCISNLLPVKLGNKFWKLNKNCPYNPYICKWQGENGYVPVEDCGSYSRDTGFTPDREKIKTLNREIWGEE
jgi:radical SAM protein with 4Fe4S-binding SPASM domain